MHVIATIALWENNRTSNYDGHDFEGIIKKHDRRLEKLLSENRAVLTAKHFHIEA